MMLGLAKTLERSAGSAVVLAVASLLVGLLHIGPLLAIAKHLERQGQPFVFSYENYRNDLTYLTRGREVYDGHWPSSDPFADESRPTLRNPIPSVILAGALALTAGNVFRAYLLLLLVFFPINFLLFYVLVRKLVGSNLWALAVSLAATLTPLALRILNFYGTV